MKVKPLKDNILVKMIENEETSPNGIILTGTARGESNFAEVIETPETDTFRAAVQSVYDAYPQFADYIARIQALLAE